MGSASRREVDRHLEELLEMPEDERPRRLAEIESEELRAEVARMLELALDEKGLLETESVVGFELLAEAVAAASSTALGRNGRVGPYRLVEEIGRGGMGVVYLAERADGQFERRVALKVIRPDALVDRGRFAREQQLLAGLIHPAIARLYDGGVTDEGEPYYVMELVEGQPIDRYCRARNLGRRERLELLAEVCSAVAAAHRQLIVHRDLKPSNILVDGSGGVKLVDFGIAKLERTDVRPAAPSGVRSTDALTFDGAPLTVQYASPEQVLGGPVTVASDVYQLGLLAFELITGEPPYEVRGLPWEEARRRIAETQPRAPSAVAPAERDGIASADLDAVILRALAKEPESRYPTAAHLREDLVRSLEHRPVSARDPSPGYRARRFIGRHPWSVATSASVLLLLALLIGIFTTRLARERDATRAEAERSAEVLDFVTDLFRQAGPERGQGPDTTLRELLDYGSERIRGRLRDRPLTRASILTEIGAMYEVLGLYDEAEPLLLEGLELRRAELEDATGVATSRELAHSWLRLGRLAHGRGQLDSAEALLEQALGGFEGAEDARGLANALSALGIVLNDLGRYQESMAVHRRALDRFLSIGDEHGAANERLHLANSAVRLDRRAEARALVEEALTTYETLLGPEHVTVANALTNLAIYHSQEGSPERAEPLFARALEIYEKSYGPHHPRVARAWTNLGNVSSRLGRHDQARERLERALEVYREIPGEHFAEGIILLNLGVAETRRERFGEAEELYRRALGVLRTHLPERHREIAITLVNLGEVVLRQGRLDEAQAVLLESEQVFVDALGSEHPMVALPLLLLGEIHSERGSPDRALPLLERALEIRRRAEGIDPALVEEAEQAYEALRRGLGLGP